MAVLLVIYLVFIVQYAIILISVDELVARIMGVALLVIPVIGAWALVVELRFGFRSEKLAKILDVEGGLPLAEAKPSGRPTKDGSDFDLYKAEVEASPQSWRAWFRLALAYDASGDRRRARWATRQAIRYSR